MVQQLDLSFWTANLPLDLLMDSSSLASQRQPFFVLRWRIVCVTVQIKKWVHPLLCPWKTNWKLNSGMRYKVLPVAPDISLLKLMTRNLCWRKPKTEQAILRQIMEPWWLTLHRMGTTLFSERMQIQRNGYWSPTFQTRSRYQIDYLVFLLFHLSSKLSLCATKVAQKSAKRVLIFPIKQKAKFLRPFHSQANILRTLTLFWYHCFLEKKRKVKSKMTFASAKSQLKSKLGNQYFVEEIHATSKEELSYQSYKGHSKPVDSRSTEEVMREKIAKDEEKERSEREKSHSANPSGYHAIAIPLSENAKQAILKFKSADFNFVSLVRMSRAMFLSLFLLIIQHTQKKKENWHWQKGFGWKCRL